MFNGVVSELIRQRDQKMVRLIMPGYKENAGFFDQLSVAFQPLVINLQAGFTVAG